MRGAAAPAPSAPPRPSTHPPPRPDARPRPPRPVRTVPPTAPRRQLPLSAQAAPAALIYPPLLLRGGSPLAAEPSLERAHWSAATKLAFRDWRRARGRSDTPGARPSRRAIGSCPGAAGLSAEKREPSGGRPLAAGRRRGGAGGDVLEVSMVTARPRPARRASRLRAGSGRDGTGGGGGHPSGRAVRERRGRRTEPGHLRWLRRPAGTPCRGAAPARPCPVSPCGTQGASCSRGGGFVPPGLGLGGGSSPGGARPGTPPVPAVLPGVLLAAGCVGPGAAVGHTGCVQAR